MPSTTTDSAAALLADAQALAMRDAKTACDLDSTTAALVEIAIACGAGARSELLREVMRSALDDGASFETLAYVVLQLSAYLGFTRVQAAAAALDEIATRRAGASLLALPSASPVGRYQRGSTDYTKLNPNALANINAAFGDVAPDLIQSTFSSFADTYAHSPLDVRLKQLLTIGALAAMGSAAPQLTFHIRAALDAGVSESQVVGVLILAQARAGMPAAYNALLAAKAAFAAPAGAGPGYS